MSETNGMDLAIEESLLSLTERVRREQQDETDHITAIRVSHDFEEVPLELDPITHEDPAYARGWNDALAIAQRRPAGAWSYDADHHWLVFTEDEGASAIVAYDVPATWGVPMLAVLNTDDTSLALALRDWMDSAADDRQTEDDLRDAAETWLELRNERGLLP